MDKTWSNEMFDGFAVDLVNFVAVPWRNLPILGIHPLLVSKGVAGTGSLSD